MSDNEAWRQLQAEVYATKLLTSLALHAISNMTNDRDEFLSNLHSSCLTLAEKQEFFNASEEDANLLRERITERAESLIAGIRSL
jgi:hypothetical protein